MFKQYQFDKEELSYGSTQLLSTPPLTSGHQNVFLPIPDSFFYY